MMNPIEDARQKRTAELETDALRAVLNARNGRRFLYRHMMNCGMDGFPFTGENNTTNFNCGRQSVAADLKANIKAINGDALALMIREAIEDENYVNGSDPTQSDTSDYDPTA